MDQIRTQVLTFSGKSARPKPRSVVESARLLTHLDLHKLQILEYMCVYNMSDYAEMCEEPCFVWGHHIWTVDNIVIFNQ